MDNIKIIFTGRDEIYNNGLIHIFDYAYDNGNTQKHSNDFVSVELNGVQFCLHYNKLVLNGPEPVLKSSCDSLFEKFDEKPVQTKNLRYYYDETKDELVWTPKIQYADMNKLKPYQRKQFDDKTIKRIQQLIQQRRNADKMADITDREREAREMALNELIKKTKVFVYKTPDQLYREAILNNRDFSEKGLCDCCKNVFYSSGEVLDTSKYYNMSSRSKFFEFNDTNNQHSNLCVFCYMFYQAGRSPKHLLKLGKHAGVFNGDLLSLFRLKKLLMDITNKYGTTNHPGYNMDKYFYPKPEDVGKLPRLSAQSPAESILSTGYVLFNYLTKEKTKLVDFENLELILFIDEGILKVSRFNKFQYLFRLFSALDKVDLGESKEKTYAIPVFIKFFQKLDATSKKPFREIISQQLISEIVFFDVLSELFYGKLYDKKKKKPTANISQDVLDNFISVYNNEVVKMDISIINVAKQIGGKIGKFSQETKDLELIYKIRELGSESKFIEYLRNSQFKAVKSNKMIFLNEELDDAIKLVSDATDSELKDRLDLVACYAIQKYLAMDYMHSKKEEGKQ